MADTPFFPAWSARFNPVGSHSGRLRRIVSALTLCQLEKCFAPWIPTQLFPKAANHQNSRDRYYTRWRTFWSMLWQALHPLQRELYTRLIAHNLIRCTMAQAASDHHVPLEQLSFKGSLDAVRHFAHAMTRARSRARRQRLWTLLLQTLARDLVPERPGRREPRAVKRRKNKYPRLDAPRHKFRDHLKRHDRRKISRLRKLGLM